MTRTLVVGWDGGTWSVAGPLARAGRLPVVASLREGGAEGVLESVPNMNSAPAWSTIATGLDPGRHGIFYFDERVVGTYGRSIINAERRAGATLWRMASEAGHMTEVVESPAGGLELKHCNCPIQDVAARAGHPCRHEQDIYKRLLGAAVARSSWLGAGDPNCTYDITTAERKEIG